MKLSPIERRLNRHQDSLERYQILCERDLIGVADLIEALQGEFGRDMDERYGRLIVERNLWEEALALAFHKDARVAFRSSWALEWAYYDRRDAFIPFIPRFLLNYFQARNPSVHRHYTKMLCDLMRRGLFIPDDLQAEQIAEKTFDLLIGTDTKSAVRVWAAEILFELTTRIGWVAEHLEEVLRHQIDTIPTPAILNHYAKLLKRITMLK